MVKAVSLYDIERMCERAVRIVGLDYPELKNRNKALKIVVEVSGVAKKGWGKDKKVMEIANEQIEMRFFALSNYKSVYWKVSPTLFDFFYGERIQENNQWVEDSMEFSDLLWVREAHHSSCWTEGFCFRDKIDEVTSIKIIEMGIGESAFIENENDEEAFIDYNEKERSLLGELNNFQKWNINASNEIALWSSFMVEMDKNDYQSAFTMIFTKSVGEGENYRFFERETFIFFDYDNKPFMVTTRTNKNKAKAIITICPYNVENLEKHFGFELNCFNSFNFEENIQHYLGNVTNELALRGYEVTVKRD